MEEKVSFALYIMFFQIDIASKQLCVTVNYEQGGTTLTVNWNKI